MKHVHCRRLLSGFSLVELISVLILIGIVSVVAVNRFNATPFQTAGFDQELRSALRFAQKFAIMSGCDVQVDIDAATNGYALSLRSDVGAPATCLSASGAFGPLLPSPTGGDFSGTAPAGVDIATGLTFFYDRQGRPSIDGTIGITGGNSITVAPETGYIY